MNTLYYGDNLKVLREQILTVEEVLNGAGVFKKATPHNNKNDTKQGKFDL